jgi:hypothetical protein
LGDFLRIEVFFHRRVGGRADGAEQEEDRVVLDQTAGRLDGFRGAVGVVERQNFNLTAVDAARFIHSIEISARGVSDRAGDRNRTAEWGGLAEPDFGGGGAGIVRLSHRRGG